MRTLGRRMLLSGKLLTTHAQTAHQTSKKQLFIIKNVKKLFYAVKSRHLFPH